MSKVLTVIKNVLAFISGLNFYGIGLLFIAIAMWFFMGKFFNPFGWVLVGVFIGKNTQAIKEWYNSIQ